MVVDTKLYDILGCKPEATDRELKKAFMLKARQLHPDKNKDDPNATEKFQELNEAYEVLKNPETREIYDKYGPEGLKEGAGGDSSFADILSHLFNFDISGRGGPASRPRTRDIRKEIPATLEELYNGAEKKIKVDRHVICPVCKGSGCKEGKKPEECQTCKGKGQVLAVQNVPGMGRVQTVATCPDCHGAGQKIKEEDRCEKCGGDTIIQETKEFDVHIERGMKTGSRIVFQGESDEVPDADPGDLVIIISEEPHPVFKRRNDDLLLEKDINLYEALYGAKFIVDTLDDRQLLVETKPGEVLTPGIVKSIEREGMPTQANPYERGKLFIQFNVKFPKADQLNDELKQSLVKICPPEQLPKHNEEDIYPVHMQDAELEEFTKNKAAHSERRREAYASDGSDDYEPDDDDEDDDDDGEGAQAGCAPM